jgi:ABC-type glycerol-3-phosphate transport system permease component
MACRRRGSSGASPFRWPGPPPPPLRCFRSPPTWNDLFWPLIATSDPALATPPRGIVYFRDAEAGDDVGPLMAASVVVTLPLILGFLLAQRRVTQGIATGGLKA